MPLWIMRSKHFWTFGGRIEFHVHCLCNKIVKKKTVVVSMFCNCIWKKWQIHVVKCVFVVIYLIQKIHNFALKISISQIETSVFHSDFQEKKNAHKTSIAFLNETTMNGPILMSAHSFVFIGCYRIFEIESVKWWIPHAHENRWGCCGEWKSRQSN